MAKLSREDVVTLETLAGRGFAMREIARKLGVSEGAVRYQLRRRAEGAVDGRSRQPFLAAGYRGAPPWRHGVSSPLNFGSSSVLVERGVSGGRFGRVKRRLTAWLLRLWRVWWVVDRCVVAH